MSQARAAGAIARPWWRWLLLSAAVVAADQASKAMVESALHVGEQRAITGFFSIVLAHNAGAAFSLLAEASGWQRYLFTLIAVVAAVLFVGLLRRGGDRLYCLSLALMLGGTVGNLVDRLTLGRVVDFLLLHDYLPFDGRLAAQLDPFPAFNLADSALTAGVVLLLLDSFRPRRGTETGARR